MIPRFLFVLLVFLFAAGICCNKADGQSSATDYRSVPLPSFGIRLIEGSYYNTGTIHPGKPTVFILFSTDCHHCADLAHTLRDSLPAFQGCNLFLISPPMPFKDIQHFAQVNGVAGQPDLRVGQDTAFFFGSFYRAGTVPFIVIYDRKKKWFKTLEAMNHLTELLSELRRMRTENR